ncbi:hypothetical protein HBA55_10595 [Pseudomaricurvus alkylphenolicus]|uniref:hypothetical protein n=1 Tax=Pseudomaricurvus alkylphenolicus TaxID=1306991 RepID=UPI0014249A89|nr:hypothetical protein [Pseudomaricurvus alkylphenolicus]NIB40038.1 hypothetical protein [Pseudomaricurvus alkylphenolicus]
MKKLCLSILALTAAMLSPQFAYAYLDPGSGSFLIQMLIAGLVGAFYTIKMYWYRLKALVGEWMGKDVERNEADDGVEKKDQDTDQ